MRDYDQYHANMLQVQSDEITARGKRIVELEAENAALREIVQAVADGEACWYDEVGSHCGFCDQVFDPRVHDRASHADGCRVPKARALLSGMAE